LHALHDDACEFAESVDNGVRHGVDKLVLVTRTRLHGVLLVGLLVLCLSPLVADAPPAMALVVVLGALLVLTASIGLWRAPLHEVDGR
jgi:hypothetical protein